MDPDAVVALGVGLGPFIGPILGLLWWHRRSRVAPAPPLAQGVVNGLPAVALDWTVTQGIEGWSGQTRAGPWTILSRKEQGFASGGGESGGKRTEWLRVVEVTGEGLAGLGELLMGRVSTADSLSVGQADFDFRARLDPSPTQRARLMTALSPAARGLLMDVNQLGEVSLRGGRLRFSTVVGRGDWPGPDDTARLAGRLVAAADAMLQALEQGDAGLAERAISEPEPAARVIALDLLAEQAPGTAALAHARAAAAADPDACVQWAATLARPGDALAAFPEHDAIAAPWLRPRYHVFPDVPVEVLARVAGSGGVFAARAAELLREGWGEAHEAACLAELPDAAKPKPLLEVLGRRGGISALDALAGRPDRASRSALGRLRARLADERGGRLSPAEVEGRQGELSEVD